MPRFSLAPAPALAAALLLAGCAGTRNRSLDSVHQPVVSRTAYAFDLLATPDGLAPGEDARLAGWMDALRVGYGDRVSVDDGGGNGAARADVARAAAAHGLLLADDLPVASAPLAPGTVRVTVARAAARVPGCPDYTRMGQPELESNTSSNFGCAVNANLAAMVANPADLVRGEPGTGTTDAATAARAIDAYRKAAPTGAGGTTLKVDSAANAGSSGSK